MGVLAGGRSRAELAGAVAGQLFSVFIGGCQLNTQLPASSILLVIPNRDVKINFFSPSVASQSVLVLAGGQEELS